MMKKEQLIVTCQGIELGQGYTISPPIELHTLDHKHFRRSYRFCYDEVSATPSGYCGKARITTAGQTVFALQDDICWDEASRACVIDRIIVVESTCGMDLGFASQIAAGRCADVQLQECDVFMPGVWYRHNDGVCKGAFAATLTDRHYLLRQTRLALPYVQLRSRKDGSSISMCVLNDPSNGVQENDSLTLVDASLQYASLGLQVEESAKVSICFPGSEGETNYVDSLVSTRGWAWRYHPVGTQTPHRYRAAIRIGQPQHNAYDSMRSEWRHWFNYFNPVIHRADLDKVYHIGAELIDVYTQEYNGAMGLPFWSTVPQGTVCDLSFQMGFVGQQPMCAYHLLREGISTGCSSMVDKGRGIIDFWVTRSMEGTVLPRVWYDVFPPRFKLDYPTYTRTVADGMEGILLCYQYLRRECGNAPQAWLDFVTAFGRWLVNNQNDDGSCYRAYDPVTGAPVHMGKFNTSNIIRLLVNLYWETGDGSYRLAALKAGEYCYEHMYVPMSYIGGTADNDNTIDKEAGMLALYAFMALYDLDGDDRWLQAAQGAADFIETWTYSRHFQVKPAKGNAVFDRVEITGLSLIATGHSHSDVMMGYCPFDFYRLWLLTGDAHYLHFARFLLHNTKQTVDWSGRLGHVYPGLVEESGEVAKQFHNGLGKWLPWCTIALIEALSRLQEWFGSMDIDALEADRSAAQQRNHAQGSSFIRL